MLICNHKVAYYEKKQFGQWFRVKFEEPFAVNQSIRGKLSYPAFENRMIGFENVPASRRDEASRMNTNGWTEQIKNIEEYLLVSAKTN